MLNNKTILITGGTGSFGKTFTKYIFENYPKVKRVIIFSRDEQKQFAMMSVFSPKSYPIKYFLGDIRDKERLLQVTKGVDIIVHSAAMKHVPASEQNPMECVKTNILGSQNVIDAAFENGVKQVVALSTDKAASPINIYGASKLILEKLFTYADAQKEEQDIRLSVVRYGNIFGSKGSVVPFFIKHKEKGFLPITDTQMTRFSLRMQESIDLVMYALENGWGGEIIVPIVPSYKITDVANAVAPGVEHRVVGIRKGEKLDEVMVTKEESYNCAKRDKYYIICPSEDSWCREDYIDQTHASAVEDGFEYSSSNNHEWLSIDAIKELIDNEELM